MSVVLKWENSTFFTCLYKLFFCLFVHVLYTHRYELQWNLHFFFLWEDITSVAQHMEVVLNPLASLLHLHLVKEPVECTCKGSKGKCPVWKGLLLVGENIFEQKKQCFFLLASELTFWNSLGPSGTSCFCRK